MSLKRSSIYQQTPIFRQDTSYFEMTTDNRECLAINCVLFQVQTLPFKLNGQSPVDQNVNRPNSPKIKTQFKLIGKANRYFFIDPNGFIYNNQTLPEASRNQLFRLIVQSYYAFESGRPINGLKATSTLLIVAKKSDGKSEQPKLPSNQTTLELEKYSYGEVIYLLPASASVKYELSELPFNLPSESHSPSNLPFDSRSFALKNRNQLIILSRPKRIETLLRIKATMPSNLTEFIDLNIRMVSQKQVTNQIFKRRLFSVQLEESTAIGQSLIDLKSNESSATFSIHTGNQLGHFKLDPFSGILYLARKLNCKLVDRYTLIVLANDGSRCSFAVVRIQIAAYPHLTLPVLPLDHYQASLTENVPIGKRIVKIMAGGLTLDGFRFVLRRENQFSTSDDKRLPFEYDHQTGYLITSGPIDYERLFDQENGDILDLKLGLQFTSQTAYLKPFHNGSSSLVSSFPSLYSIGLNEVAIRIRLNGEDEFYPKFEKGLYDFRLEMEPNESGLLAVGRVHAEDADAGEDGEIIYSINSSVPNWTKDLFSLNANTGVLTMNLSGNALNGLIGNSLNGYSGHSLSTNTIASWLHSSNGYTSIIVSAKSPKPNSLSSMTVVDITLQTAQPTAPKPQSDSKNFDLPDSSRPNNKLNKPINRNKGQNDNRNVLLPSYESTDMAGHHKSQQPVNKPPSQQNSIARTVNEGSLNSQRKPLISNNLIQVYGIVIGLLGLLLVLILFSVVLLFRICNFTSKTHSSTSSNGSIYNSKNQDYDPNCQLNKSLSCLIGSQYNGTQHMDRHYNASPPSDSSTILIGQHSQLKQADFMMNMALQRNSIIYQEQHKNGGYLNSQMNSNASLVNDTGSNCNTSITILHSHENSETKSDCLNSDLSIGQEINQHKSKKNGAPITKITNLQNRNLPPIDLKGHQTGKSSGQSNSQSNQSKGQSNGSISSQIKNRPLPDIASPLDSNKNADYQELSHSTYDEVREHPNAYYGSNYLESYNHNYEAISPTYDRVEFFQNWSPAYQPVTEILSSHLMAKSQTASRPTLKSANELKRAPIHTATIVNTNRLN